MTSLSEDLAQAERASKLPNRGCSLCALVARTDDPEERSLLIRAAAGSISGRKLVSILQKQGTGIGRDTVMRHQREGHEA